MSNVSNNPAIRIMVVDDEPDLVKIVSAYLKAWKFEATGFTSSDEALKTFQKNPFFFSLVISDVRMPGMSGFELAKKMLQIRADTKIVLMTAFEIDILELDAGLPIITHKEILKKPFKLKEICDTVKKQLNITS